jgi:hypothetical protein
LGRIRLLPATVLVVVLLLVLDVAASGRAARFSPLTLFVGIGLAAGWVLLAMHRPALMPAALLVFASLVPFPLSFTGKTPFGVVSATGAVATVAFAAFLYRRLGEVPIGNAEVVAGLVWVIVLLLSSVLSSTQSDDLRFTLNRTRMIAVGVLGAYLVGMLVARHAPRTLDYLIPAVGVIAALAIAERLFGLSPYHWLKTSGYPLGEPPAATRFEETRVRLGYFHASTLGTVLAACVGIVVAKTRGRISRGARVVLVLLVLAIYCTLTFQAWVATSVAVIILAVGLPRVRLLALAAGAAFAVVIATGVVGPVNDLVIHGRLQAQGSDQSEVDYRLALVPASLHRSVHAPLLGSGPGTFNRVEVRAVIDNQLVQLVDDNTYTAALVETGYPGMLALVVFLALVARRLRRQTEPWRRWAGLSALAAWVTMGMSVDVLFGDQALVPVWLVIGALAGGAATTTATETVDEQSSALVGVPA